MRFWPQDEHQNMHAISWLKHVVVVLSKSEGPQKWLAPCGTDVHRAARTIDVSLLEKDSHRQNKIIMRNEVLIAQNMENLGAMSLCLFEQLRPLLRTLTFVTYYCVDITRTGDNESPCACAPSNLGLILRLQTLCMVFYFRCLWCREVVEHKSQ
jgi:hypothetical protein